MDIALERGHREVIKVLLKDKNWHKLLLPISHERIDHKLNLMNLGFRKQITRYTRASRRENPQLCKLFELKMWDSILVVLDKCRNDLDGSYDFTKIDPECTNIQRHPLMLMAKSGQEQILKHDTTRKLLNLKWRFLPRFAFYSNLFFYLLFIALFAIYSYKLSNYYISGLEKINAIRGVGLGGGKNLTNNSTTPDGTILTFGYGGNNLEEEEKKEREIIDDFNSDSVTNGLNWTICLVIILSLLKKTFQVFFVDRLAFFSSPQNLAEIASYLIALAAITSNDLDIKLNLCSCAVLVSFIVFSFLIQKLRVFGLYVLAFRRTLENSAKFFPVFFLVYIGFNLSFRLRTHFGVTYFNSSASTTLIRTLSMALGELENDEMGLDTDYALNYILYFLFIGLMCVITFNLFVGKCEKFDLIVY